MSSNNNAYDDSKFTVCLGDIGVDAVLGDVESPQKKEAQQTFRYCFEQVKDLISSISQMRRNVDAYHYKHSQMKLWKLCYDAGQCDEGDPSYERLLSEYGSIVSEKEVDVSEAQMQFNSAASKLVKVAEGIKGIFENILPILDKCMVNYTEYDFCTDRSPDYWSTALPIFHNSEIQALTVSAMPPRLGACKDGERYDFNELIDKISVKMKDLEGMSMSVYRLIAPSLKLRLLGDFKQKLEEDCVLETTSAYTKIKELLPVKVFDNHDDIASKTDEIEAVMVKTSNVLLNEALIIGYEAILDHKLGVSGHYSISGVNDFMKEHSALFRSKLVFDGGLETLCQIASQEFGIRETYKLCATIKDGLGKGENFTDYLEGLLCQDPYECDLDTIRNLDHNYMDDL